MRGVALCAAVLFSAVSFAETASDSVELQTGPSLLASSAERSASLLQGLELDATYRTSASPALRLSDDLRFRLAQTPAPLDQGGGVSSDVRQILALILGFIPGFGIGHLIARDRDGFILFLIVDIALYALAFTVGHFLGGPFWGLGGLIWIVVHVIQALDAYAEAGGERIVQAVRERAVELVRREEPPRLDAPLVTTRLFALSF